MFIILSYPRSGTHLLAHLLNSHPELNCYGEVLLKDHYGKAWSGSALLPRKPLSELKDNEGCIVMYHQFIEASEEDKRRIQNSKVIHLVRTNIIEHVASLDKVHGVKTNKKRIQILRDVIAQQRHKALAYKFKYYFPISYEAICHNQEIREYENKELCEFLGIKPHLLTTNLSKMSKKMTVI